VIRLAMQGLISRQSMVMLITVLRATLLIYISTGLCFKDLNSWHRPCLPMHKEVPDLPIPWEPYAPV
jgi:hypothetical protein